MAAIRVIRFLIIGLGSLILPAHAIQAQGFPVFQESLPVASLNATQLFARSLAGAGILEESRKNSIALAEENRRIEAELEREELELTELRKTLPAEEFRTLAEAFDQKVVTIRREQNAKAINLSQDLETARQKFTRAVEPVLQAIMAERGIIFILNEQAVAYADTRGDITEEVLRRVDQAIGSTLEDQK